MIKTKVAFLEGRLLSG